MKILRIIARLNVGGPARQVVWLTNELQDEEFSSTLAAGSVPDGEEDMQYFADQNNVVPVFIEEMSRELSLKDAVSLWKVLKLIRKEKPDIIHTHTAKAGTVGRIAAFFYRILTPQILTGRKKSVKTVHTYHGHVFHSYYGTLKTRIFILIEKVLAMIATDKLVVISRQQYDEIHEKFGIGKAEQFEIIPLGLDLGQFENLAAKRNTLREEVGADEGDILVGLVGRLTEIKNISMLLQIARRYLTESSETDVKLKFIVIGDGNMRKQLELQAASLELDRTVFFLGSRTDAAAFYGGLDIVALTSLNEGTPLSLIEAMACGKPVISTSVGGVVDLLGNKSGAHDGFDLCERGVSVGSGDVEGFYQGLLCLANNAAIRRNVAGSAHEFVTKNYSKEKLVSNIKNLYRKLSG